MGDAMDVDSKQMQLDLEFDVVGTTSWIRSLGLKRVALQLADGMLQHAAWLALRMRGENEGCDVFILADSSVSSWDPDVVAAQHVNADGLVMYGRASQAQPASLPVRVVHGRQALDIPKLVAALQSRVAPTDRLAVLPAGAFAYRHDDLLSALKAAFSNVCVGEIVSEIRQRSEPTGCGSGGCGAGGCGTGGCGTCAHCSCAPSPGSDAPAAQPDEAQGVGATRIGNFVVSASWLQGEGGTGAGVGVGEDGAVQAVFVGEKGPELTRMILENSALSFSFFDPASNTLSEAKDLLDCTAALKRRYFLMMKTKDAERVGIMVATTAVPGYKAMMDRLKTIIKAADKIPYVFYVGKINPAKLANFPEINVFVLIASPENTVSVDPSLPRPTHKSASVLYSFVRLKPLPVSADPHFA